MESDSDMATGCHQVRVDDPLNLNGFDPGNLGYSKDYG